MSDWGRIYQARFAPQGLFGDLVPQPFAPPISPGIVRLPTGFLPFAADPFAQPAFAPQTMLPSFFFPDRPQALHAGGGGQGLLGRALAAAIAKQPPLMGALQAGQGPALAAPPPQVAPQQADFAPQWVTPSEDMIRLGTRLSTIMASPPGLNMPPGAAGIRLPHFPF